MNCIKSAIQYLTRAKDQHHSIIPFHIQERTEYILRVAALLYHDTHIAGIGWVIIYDGREINSGIATINSHNDINIALYRAFHYGLECALKHGIHSLVVETANPDFMLVSDRESNPVAKKTFKRLLKLLNTYIPKHFKRIQYSTLLTAPEDVVAYINEYFRGMDEDEEFKDEQCR